MSDPVAVVETDPEEAFAALADETRVAILRALWDPENKAAERRGWPSLSFSALREAADVADSGQFNYHLDTLRGRYVRKSEAGYMLTPAGRQVIGAVLSGSFTLEGSIPAQDFGEPCQLCGGDQTFRYEDCHVVVECEDCAFRSDGDVPPRVLEGLDSADVQRVAYRYMEAKAVLPRRGFCPYCEGRVTPALLHLEDLFPPDESPPAAWQDLPMVRYGCPRCATDLKMDLASAVLEEPAVVAFHHDHGIDVRAAEWLKRTSMDPDSARFVEDAAAAAAVTFEAGGETLTVEVDAHLEVVRTEREPA